MKIRNKQILVLFFFTSLSAFSCKSKIGDSCDNNVDCSPDGDRICDLSQPGGYCTVPDCSKGSCPDESVCVKFWEGAHTRTWCMKRCTSDGGCRSRYFCNKEDDISEILDDVGEKTGYCTANYTSEKQEDGTQQEDALNPEGGVELYEADQIGDLFQDPPDLVSE